MNRSAEPGSATTVGGNPAANVTGWQIWPAAAALVLYPLLKYGVAFRLPLSVWTFLAIVASYVLVIYLIRSIGGAVYYGGLRPILAASAVALVAGWIVCHPLQRVMMTAEMVMISGAAITVGARVRNGDSGSKAYLYGALAIIAGGIAMYAAQWGQLMTIFQTAGRETVESLTANLTAFRISSRGGSGVRRSDERRGGRHGPTGPGGHDRKHGRRSFRSVSSGSWRAAFRPRSRRRCSLRFPAGVCPFALTTVVIAAALGRILGGPTLQLIADNMFMALAICYCVGGLSVLAYAANRLKLPIVVRILFYIAMLLTGLIGFSLVVLLGFFDSFADWRKLSGQSIELDKS